MDNSFDLMQKSIIGINIKNYKKDSLENYKKIMLEVLSLNSLYLQDYKKSVHIIADDMKFGKKAKVEREIQTYLNESFHMQGGIKFSFGNSKSFGGIQLADLIAYKIGKKYFYDEVLDDYLLENLFNIDINKEFET